MTTYSAKFTFTCQYCLEENGQPGMARTRLTYIVPQKDYDGSWIRLSCKNCERPIISIWHKFINSGEYHLYRVYDIKRQKYILGDDDNSVSRDSFCGWVMDHNGERNES